MTEVVENSYSEQSFLITDSALIINNKFALGTSEEIKLTTCSMPEYEKLSGFARKIYRAPLAYLTSRDHDLIVGRDGSTLNMTFETSPASMLVLARESVDAKMRIEQAISIVNRTESIRSAYHHGIFIITKEAWRILGTFRPDAAAELTFVEILEKKSSIPCL